MRIYLAATTSAMTVEGRKEFIKRGQPKYLLNTFFEGERTCLKVMQDVEKDNFLLDSGAFSFMSGATCTKENLIEYAERYIAFINQYQVRRFFEIDIDTIFGLEFAEYLRAKIERETGKQTIPVWHKSRGIDYFKRMVDEYEYIAIGGLVFHVKQSEWDIIHRMVDYAAKRGTKIHGLGFTKTQLLKDWNWYSVDSSSWGLAAGRGQQRHDFDPVKGCIVSHHIEGNGKKTDGCALALHNGIEWCKYQKFMDLRKGFYGKE